MLRSILFIILIISSGSLFSQVKISTYKALADRAIQQNLDNSLLSKIKCEGFTLFRKDSSESWYQDYKIYKSEKVKIEKITFTYLLFSTQIKNDFKFEITVTNLRKVDTSFISYIPECIRWNLHCNFISRDSAIKIAIQDSLLYPNNISVVFEKPSFKTNFYWIITSHLTTLGIKSKRPSRTASKRSNTSSKIVNAETGQITKLGDYIKPD